MNTSILDSVYDTHTSFPPYKDNYTYRNMLRTAFKMDKNKVNEGAGLLTESDMDDESWDEFVYDSGSLKRAMDLIFELTENHPLFAELYEIAAAQMISTDPTIGHAVLMSYDYYYMYHNCLCAFIQSPYAFTEKSDCYLKLKRAFMKE